MSNNNCPEKNKCDGVTGPPPSGFWAGLFGGGSSSSCTSCSSCGNAKCTCNKDLCDHLKKHGLGQLPPLYEKCEDTPGYRTGPGKSTCKGSKDECPPPPKKDCGCPPPPKKDCGCPPPPPPKQESCQPPPPKQECPPPKKEEKCDCEKKPKCPPMPVTDCCDCKPAWMSCPPSLTRTYPAPEGVIILPISVGGRNGAKGSCGNCGQDKSKAGKPKVSANCPMMKPKCPGLVKEEKEGFLAKLTSMFKGKAEEAVETVKELSPLEKVCAALKVEDEKIRHHRDVFDTKLVVRKDGYMCPFLQEVECEGESDVDDCTCPQQPLPVQEEDCGEEEIVIEEEEDCDEEVEDECVEDAEDECVEDAEGECIVETEEAPPEEDSNDNCEEEDINTPVEDPIDEDCPEQTEEECPCPEEEIPAWVPPPPPSCNCCGAKIRGDNDKCHMCKLTKRARDAYWYDTCPAEEPAASNNPPPPEEPQPEAEAPLDTSDTTPPPDDCPDESSPSAMEENISDENCAWPSAKEEEKVGENKGFNFDMAPLEISASECGPCNQPSDLPKDDDFPNACSYSKDERFPGCSIPRCGNPEEEEAVVEAKPEASACCKKRPPSDESKYPVWTIPKAPACPHCGAAERGNNEDCYLCSFTRKARDPSRFDYTCPNSSFNFSNPPEDSCFSKKKVDKCYSDEFEMTSENKPVYEGGMCINRAMNFLWQTNPFESLLEKMGFSNECYKGFERCASDENGPTEEMCTCDEHHKYKGGMSSDQYQKFIWSKLPPTYNKE